MSIQDTLVELLKCALTHDGSTRLVGNVTAKATARAAATFIIRCPVCGAEAWCNIDCTLCAVCHDLLRD